MYSEYDTSWSGSLIPAPTALGKAFNSMAIKATCTKTEVVIDLSIYKFFLSFQTTWYQVKTELPNGPSKGHFPKSGTYVEPQLWRGPIVDILFKKTKMFRALPSYIYELYCGNTHMPLCITDLQGLDFILHCRLNHI